MPIDKIRFALSQLDSKIYRPAYSWNTVKNVVNEFPQLTKAQLVELPGDLQMRWREIHRIGQEVSADIIYESHAELSIRPPIANPHKPDTFTIKHKESDVCILKIERKSILIQSLQLRTSDPKVPYQLMLFESDPRKLVGRVEQEDMIQMESVTQRIYTYPVGNPLPYINRDGKKALHVAICVFARNLPIDFLTGELTNKRKEYLKHAINFILTLRYSVI